MRAVDNAVLALLREYMGGADQVHDGQLIPPRAPGAQPVVVSYPLPLVIYTSNVGADANRRLAGRRVRRSVFFSLTYVGTTPAQTKWEGEKIRALLERRRLTVVGFPKVWAVNHLSSDRIRRDDDVMRPDGSPLYYGIDDYECSLMNAAIPNPVPVPQ